MKTVLISWIGGHDLEAAKPGADTGLGPIASLLEQRVFDEAVLLCNYAEDELTQYRSWLSDRTSQPIRYEKADLDSPTSYREVYETVEPVVSALATAESELNYFLSPGTPAMATIWVLLGKTKFPGRFLQSYESEVEDVDIPFDLAADYLPHLRQVIDEEINAVSSGDLPIDPAFENFVAVSKPMRRIVTLAQKISTRSVSVLIEGNPGTGKELLARCIHKASSRDAFVKVDCAAYAEAALETELFGSASSPGAFKSAENGTLFLSRLESLPNRLQLRLIDQLSISDDRSQNTRIIAGVDSALREEISTGRFEPELFYLLSAVTFNLPDIRNRSGDLPALIDFFFNELNEFHAEQSAAKPKKLSAGARRALLDHKWPGNIMELINTLQRAILWTDTVTIREEDMREAILEPIVQNANETILDREIADGIDIQEIIKEVEAHYLRRAWKDSGFNKKRTAQLLGLKNYQTAANWLQRHGIA